MMNMSPIVEILPDKDALIKRAYEVMVAHMQNAVDLRGRATIALSGGSTPKPLYAALAKADLPWDKIYVFWGDERYVPHDDEKSNFRMTREALLNHVPIPTENIFPVPTSANDPTIDAVKYSETLQSFFQVDPGDLADSADSTDSTDSTKPNSAWPALDFVLQGMGDDGHTASLFPNTAALDVRDRLVTVGNHNGEPRITFTVPLINQGRTVMFLVAGESKQEAISQVFSPSSDDHVYPSKLINPGGTCFWLMDAAAGQGVPPAFNPANFA